jgi:WD40 repeat protein
MLEIQTRSRHPVSGVVFSPDGATFAVVQAHDGVTLFDRATGRVTAAMPAPRAGDHVSAAFCDGGAKLLVGTHQRLFLYDCATGSLLAQQVGWMFGSRDLGARDDLVLALTWHGLRELRLPREAGGPILSQSLPLTTRATLIALAPCGMWVVGVYARSGLSLSDIDTRRVAATLDHPSRGADGAVHTAAFAADGSRLAVLDGNEILAYDTPRRESGVEGPDEEAGEPSRSGLELAPKPRLLLKPVFRLGSPEDYRPAPLTPVAFSDARPNLRWRPPVAFTPDGRGLLVRRPRNRVQLWDVASGNRTGEWSWRLEVTSLAVAPDGLTAVAGGRFGRAVVWDME